MTQIGVVRPRPLPGHHGHAGEEHLGHDAGYEQPGEERIERA